MVKRNVRAFAANIFEYEPNFSPLVSSVPSRGCEPIDHLQHCSGQVVKTQHRCVCRLPLGFWGALLRGEQLALDIIHDRGCKLFRLVKLEAHLRKQIGVQSFQHGHAPGQMVDRGFKFFVSHENSLWVEKLFSPRFGGGTQ